MKQPSPTLALYFVAYTRPDPICLLLANGKQETACCVSDDLKPSCPGGEGGGANRKSLLVVLVKYVTSRLTPDHVEKTAYFQGESLKFVADWLEKNNLSKLKSVFEVTFILNC